MMPSHVTGSYHGGIWQHATGVPRLNRKVVREPKLGKGEWMDDDGWVHYETIQTRKVLTLDTRHVGGQH
jgi:hypothetical protein